jgi:hypothetical protein
VIANLHAVKGQFLDHLVMDRLNQRAGQRSASDVGLIRRDDEQKAGTFESGAGLGDARQDLEFCEASWRIGFTVANQRAVDDAVAVQEDRGETTANLGCSIAGHVSGTESREAIVAWEAGHGHFVLSHFVLATLSFG